MIEVYRQIIKNHDEYTCTCTSTDVHVNIYLKPGQYCSLKAIYRIAGKIWRFGGSASQPPN